MGRGVWSRVGAQAVERLDLPAELAHGMPQMELMGQRQFLMARHKGVLSYSTEVVEISAEGLIVRIIGEKLELVSMSGDALRIRGRIRRVEWVN